MWTQPVLTANGTIGTDEFAVLSGGGADSTAWKAFDNSTSSYCNAMNNGAWIEFYSKNPLEISSITITSSNQALPSIGIFQVSYDGNAWEDVQQWEDVDQTASSAQINLETPTVGNYFRLLSQGKSLVKPDNNADIGNVIITAEEVCQPVSISRILSNNSFGDKYISHYLPFDNSTTENLRGNDWTENGTLSISENNAINGTALQLNNNYLSYTNGTFLGGQDFTIRLSFCITSFNGNYQRIVTLFNTVNSDKDCISFRRYSNTSTYYIVNFGTSSSAFSLSTNTIYQFEWDYSHSESLSRIFINGELKTTLNKSIPRTKFNIIYLGKSEWGSDGLWTGSIDEFMIIDGAAVHKQNFPNPDNIKWDDIRTNITKLYPLSDFLIFTGNSGSYATIPTNILTSNTSFTAEFKISSTSTKSSDNNYQMPTIFGIEISGNNQDDFGFCINNGKLAYWAEPIWTPSTQASRILTDYFVSDGEPHTISFVSELSKSIKIYCDGKLVHENNYNITIPYNSILYIGSNTTSNAPLEIKFYEARFWSKALTQEEVFANIDGTEEGLEAWYKTSSNDLSNHNRNLTLHNVYQYKEDSISENADIQCTVHNNINNYRKVYLPFDKSPTEDLCGNTWTTNDSPTIGSANAVNYNALQISGGAYLQTDDKILIGGQDFSVSWWSYGNSSQVQFGGMWGIAPQTNANYNGIYFARYDKNSNLAFSFYNATGSIGSATVNTTFMGVRRHYLLIYQHDTKTVTVFVDGVQSAQVVLNEPFPRLERYILVGRTPYAASQYFNGTIDEFQIYDGLTLHTENFTPPTHDDYLAQAMEINGEGNFSFDIDIDLVIKNNLLLLQALKVWLPFNESTTQDLCGNEWTVEGTVSFEDQALQLDGNGYIYTAPPNLGTSDFTIDWWEFIPSSRNSFLSEVIVIDGSTGSAMKALDISYQSSTTPSIYLGQGTGTSWSCSEKRIGNKIRDEWVHRAVVRSGSTIYAFENGTLYTSFSCGDLSIATSGSSLFVGDFKRASRPFIGKLDEIRIHVGVALWTEDFTPPTNDDYLAQTVEFNGEGNFSFDVDIDLVIKNDSLLPKVYLPFDKSPTEDLCGNEWISFYDPTIKNNALQTDGFCHLTMNNLISLGEKDFTIHGWFNVSSNRKDWSYIFSLYKTENSYNDTISLQTTNNVSQMRLICFGTTSTFTITMDILHNFAIAYIHSSSSVILFIDGQKTLTISKTIPLTDFILEISHGSYINYYGALGSIKNFTINEVDLSDENYILSLLKLELYWNLNLYLASEYKFNIECDLIKSTKNTNLNQFLTCYLPFNNSPTEDLCGNIWTIKEGTAVISEDNAFSSSALQLDGTGCLQSCTSLFLGGKDFTIDCWCYPLDTNTNYNRIWEIADESNNIIGIDFPDANQIRLHCQGKYLYTFKVRNRLIHVALVYQHKKSIISLYLNGIKVCALSKTINLTNFNTFYIGQYTGGGNYRFKGTIDEFRVYNGIARWTENFDVPKSNDYSIENIVVLPIIDNYIWFNNTYASTPTGLLSGARIFTLEIKFATTDTTSETGYKAKCLLGIDEKSANYYGMFNLGISNGKLIFWRVNASENSVMIKTDKIVNDNLIHTISLVSTLENDKYKLYLYCDGEELGSNTTDIKIAENKSIGIAFTGNSNYSKTQMKFYEARFWNKALTQAEIFANIDGTEEGLEAWYIPENGVLKDKSIKQQNPYITGLPYVYKNYIADDQCSIIYGTTNNVKPNDNIYLPLIDSPTNDLYNHQWTNIHSSTISDYALQLNGTDQYITANNKIWLGGKDFTIEFYLTKLGGTSSGPIFEIYNDETHFITLNNEGWYINYNKSDNMPTGRNHVAFVYKNTTQTIYYYLNGSLVNSRTTSIFNNFRKYMINLGTNSWDTSFRTQFWKGSIEHFHINTSEALYTGNFIPSLDRDNGLSIGFEATNEVPFYIYTKIDATIKNKALTWKYENQGTAEDLSVFGKTCTWNEDNRTNTGISFSQPERKKCFDIPSAKQIWIRFDLYQIVSNSIFRVYNEITDNVTGLCNSDSEIRLFNYGTQVFSSSDVKKNNVLQSWLLYMRSGDNGEIVLWCDGKEITRYTGNVNNGEPFNNISMSGETYLFSSETTYTSTEPFPYEADLNNYFSNVIISNEEIAVDESLCGSIADIQLNISNITDTENYLMIHMPFTSSTTEDLCGNDFTTIGEPRIELSPYMNSNALYLDGTTAIESISTFTFNRNPFTISFEFAAIFSETLNSSEMVLCHFYNENSSIKLNISVEGKVYLLVNNASITRITADTIGGMEHFVELNYDGAYFYLFVDGKKMTFSYKVFSEFQPYKLSIGAGDSKYFDGWIRNFKLYQNICIHNDINYDSLDLLLEKEFLNQDTINFNLYVDINVILNNDNWLPALENVRDYLPCDTSPVRVLTNNTWYYNTNGTLVYRSGMGPALNFKGPRSSYNLYCNNIQLGGRDFTIKFWMNIDGYPDNWQYATTPLFNLLLNNDIVLDFRSLDISDKQISILCFTLTTRIDFEINKYHLIEYIYRHKEKKIAVYVDKKCIMDVYHQIPETVFSTLGFIKFAWDPEKHNIKLDEIQVYDGISFYNKFVPATKNYYDRLKNKFVDNTKTSQFNYECSIIRKLYYTPFLSTNLLFNYPNNIIPRGDNQEFQLMSSGNILINDSSKPCQAILEFPSYYSAVIDGMLQMFYAKKLVLGGQDFVIMFDIAFWPSSDIFIKEFLRLSMNNSLSSAVLTLQSSTITTYIYYYPNKDGGTYKYSYNDTYTPQKRYNSLTKMGRILIRYNHNASTLSYITDVSTLTISNVTIDRTLYDLRIGNYRNDLNTTTNTYSVHYLKNIRIYDGNTVGNSVLLQYPPSEDELLMVYTNINDKTRFSFEADINIILVINNDKNINPHKTYLVVYKHFDVDKNITIDPSYNDMTFVTSPLISKYGLSLNHPQKIVDRIMLHKNHIMLDFWVYIKNGNGHIIRMHDTNDVFLFGVYINGSQLCISTSTSTDADSKYRFNDLLESEYKLVVPLNGSYLWLSHKWVSLKIVISSISIKVFINDEPLHANFTRGVPDIFSEQKEVYLMVGSDNLEGYINDIRLYDNYSRYGYSEIPTKQSYEQIERQRLSKAYKFYRRVDTEIEIINPERINIVIWHNNQPFKIPFHKAKSRSEVPDNSVSIYHNDNVWYSPIVLPTDTEASILRIFHNNTSVSLPTRIHNT